MRGYSGSAYLCSQLGRELERDSVHDYELRGYSLSLSWPESPVSNGFQGRLVENGVAGGFGNGDCDHRSIDRDSNSTEHGTFPKFSTRERGVARRWSLEKQGLKVAAARLGLCGVGGNRVSCRRLHRQKFAWRDRAILPFGEPKVGKLAWPLGFSHRRGLKLFEVEVGVNRTQLLE